LVWLMLLTSMPQSKQTLLRRTGMATSDTAVVALALAAEVLFSVISAV
jgi:hypothetical protein